MKYLALLLPIFVLFSCSSVNEEDFLLLIKQGKISEVEESIPKISKETKAAILTQGLLTAISEGKEEIALLLLDNRAIGDSRSFNKACKNGYSQIALKIFDSNDEVGDYLDQNGSSSLQFALAYGQEDAAKKLLTVAGQPVNMQSNFFQSPLHIASEQGYADIIPLLIDKGADVNFKNPDGMTAIYSAIQKGHIKVIGLLIDNGADLTIEADFADSKYSPLTWAKSSYTESGEAVVALLQGSN